MEASVWRVEEIQNLCLQRNKKLVVYISMGFGNPYGDAWNVDIVQHWVDKLAEMGIKIISLSDTIGVADAPTITYLFSNLIPPYPDVEFGAHLHTLPHNWEEKIVAAYEHGCRRFDAAILGLGGCPMAKDDLTGNMPTENLVNHFSTEKLGIDRTAFGKCLEMVYQVFPQTVFHG